MGLTPYPRFASIVQQREHTTVVEVNLDPTPNTSSSSYSFAGKAGELLPDLFDLP